MLLVDTHTTAARIMDTAGELFAEQGFRQTSVRDICARANVNVAAVNYHFGDKEGLYEAILIRSLDHCLDQYPIGAKDGPAEARLAEFVRMFLMRILGSGRPAWHGKLMAAEMANPTGALLKLVDQVARPTHDVLIGIVHDLLGPTAGAIETQAIASSVLGQCLFYRHSRPVIEALGIEVPRSDAEIEALADHITRFSLAGIAAARQSAQGETS